MAHSAERFAGRPRMYLALDATFTLSPAVENLGEAHGPAGPMVIVSLLAMAKLQGAGGEVRTTPKRLAEDAFLSNPDHALQVVEHAIELGTLEAVDNGDNGICVRFPRWADWQRRASDADRKAAWRASQRESDES